MRCHQRQKNTSRVRNLSQRYLIHSHFTEIVMINILIIYIGLRDYQNLDEGQLKYELLTSFKPDHICCVVKRLREINPHIQYSSVCTKVRLRFYN